MKSIILNIIQSLPSGAHSLEKMQEAVLRIMCNYREDALVILKPLWRHGYKWGERLQVHLEAKRQRSRQLYGGGDGRADTLQKQVDIKGKGREVKPLRRRKRDHPSFIHFYRQNLSYFFPSVTLLPNPIQNPASSD